MVILITDRSKLLVYVLYLRLLVILSVTKKSCTVIRFCAMSRRYGKQHTSKTCKISDRLDATAEAHVRSRAQNAGLYPCGTTHSASSNTCTALKPTNTREASKHPVRAHKSWSTGRVRPSPDHSSSCHSGHEFRVRDARL